MLRQRRELSLPAAALGLLAGCAIVLGTACGRVEERDGEITLQVTEARVRALIPGQNKTVGYFTAYNAADTPVVLIGARSTAVRAIEMHTTLRDADMVRMRKLDEVVIAAGETVRFEPGGRHLMVFDAADLGDAVEIVLLGSEGAEFHVRFRVMAPGEI